MDLNLIVCGCPHYKGNVWVALLFPASSLAQPCNFCPSSVPLKLTSQLTEAFNLSRLSEQIEQRQLLRSWPYMYFTEYTLHNVRMPEWEKCIVAKNERGLCFQHFLPVFKENSLSLCTESQQLYNCLEIEARQLQSLTTVHKEVMAGEKSVFLTTLVYPPQDHKYFLWVLMVRITARVLCCYLSILRLGHSGWLLCVCLQAQIKRAHLQVYLHYGSFNVNPWEYFCQFFFFFSRTASKN